MEINQLPFKPGTLALAIAAIVFASQPVPIVLAEEPEWNCNTADDRRNCEIVEKAPTASKSNTSESANVRKTAAITDWVPLSKLSEAQRAKLPYYACGMYVEPPRPGIDFRGNIDEAPIIAEANETNYDESELATLIGDVQIRQGHRQLKSYQATLDRQTNYGQYEGNVRFRDQGVFLIGDSGDLQIDTGRATINDASFVIHESNARGEAEQIVHNEDGTMDLVNASYTTCSPAQPGWQLSGENVSIDQETGEGVARNAVVRVENIPVFYSPVLSFPLDSRRKSGFLYPAVSQGSEKGFDLTLPYYWNIAPNYDATITPRILSKRGFLLENEFRYMIGENTLGELGVAGILGKDQYQDDNQFYNKHRWLISYNQKTRLTSRWMAEIDYAKASDKNYMRDFGSNLNLSSTGPLNQRIGTRYEGGEGNHVWQARLDAHQYQNMSRTGDNPYNKLPQMVLTGNWQSESPLSLDYRADYTKFSRANNWRYLYEEESNGIKNSIYDNGYGIKKAHGQRLYLESGASYKIENSYAFLTPAVKVQHVQYQLSNLDKQETIEDLKKSYDSFSANDYTETPMATVPVVSLDTGMYFDRLFSMGGNDYTNTLEPRMKYLYSPYVKGQEMNPVFDSGSMDFTYNSLWRDSRFSGYDRLGDANQISLGLTSRLIADNGFEKARFGIGQIVYLKDRELWINPNAGSKSTTDQGSKVTKDEEQRLREERTHRTSPLASELVYNFNRSVSVRQDMMWNTNRGELDNYGLFYSYRPSERKVLNAGYHYRNRADRFVKDKNNQNIPDGNGGYLTTSGKYSQSDISIVWPIHQSWSALGRWQYDFTNQRNLEILSGVEYNSCCYQVRVMWRQWIDAGDTNIDHAKSKNGIFLQFVLRGLGSVSAGSAKEYLNGIKGYAWDEK